MALVSLSNTLRCVTLTARSIVARRNFYEPQVDAADFHVWYSLTRTVTLVRMKIHMSTVYKETNR